MATNICLELLYCTGIIKHLLNHKMLSFSQKQVEMTITCYVHQGNTSNSHINEIMKQNVCKVQENDNLRNKCLMNNHAS